MGGLSRLYFCANRMLIIRVRIFLQMGSFKMLTAIKLVHPGDCSGKVEHLGQLPRSYRWYQMKDSLKKKLE